MKDLYMPEKIRRMIKGKTYVADTVGMSDSQVILFKDCVLKIQKESEESDSESRMMKWLRDKLPVPQILCEEKENGVEYLLMSRFGGRMACAEEFLREPKKLIKWMAEGLEMLWRVDISACPYDNSLINKLKRAEARVTKNLCDVENTEEGTYGEKGFAGPAELLAWLKENKPAEELVFSHGDCCLPNIFVREERIEGFLDLGRSGVAERYQDIALCYRSLKSNFAGRYGGKPIEYADAAWLFDELGICPDWEKVRYYILLDELF